MTRPGIAPIACLSLAAFFVGLKLTHVIDWSWVWISAPIWLPLALIICVGCILFGMGFFVDKDKSRLN